jgi:hypothetical protein
VITHKQTSHIFNGVYLSTTNDEQPKSTIGHKRVTTNHERAPGLMAATRSKKQNWKEGKQTTGMLVG